MADSALQQQFEALWRQHAGIAAKVARGYARDAEDRRDLTQEIAVQTWRSFARYDAARATFSTWMYRVALNVAISHLRRRDDARLESLDVRHLDTIAGGCGIVEPDARIELLHRFIKALPALDRALMILWLDDRGNVEIAEVLGVSTTNVSTRLNRIKNRLREQMVAAPPSGA